MQRPLPLPRPRERASDQTWRRLFQEALAEFRRVGVEHASIGRIAEAAGVSRPTFYFHFPTKDHVLLELQRTLEEPIAARIDAATTLDAAFAALADGIVEAHGTVGDPDVFAEMVRVHTRHAAGPALAEQPLPLVRALATRFVEARSAGRLHAELDPARATHLFLTCVFGYLTLPVAADECRRDLRTLASLYLVDAARPHAKGARR